MHRSQGGDQLSHLEEFVDRGLIEEVLGLVKIGKEASVYCCRAGADAGGRLVAAKVYRESQYRFKNDAVYQESRLREMGIRGSAKRAFEKRRKSSVGREVQTQTWRHHEYGVLEKLFAVGADVPQPLAISGDALLMEYIGNETTAAPQLVRTKLPGSEAAPLFERLMRNVELWLGCNCVHGDLSPHNVLYWAGEIKVIDFPQAVDPRFNSHAHELLSRDVANLVRYFEPYGVEADAVGLADDLWRRFTFAEL
jgi:RIO kinase 1